ncbi:MAG: hypothetical protein AAB567_02550 [Patescibacteria group bacterium]
MRRNPISGDDVGGASFAMCKIDKDVITIVLGGDCFVLFKNEKGLSFLTGFDEASAVELRFC